MKKGFVVGLAMMFCFVIAAGVFAQESQDLVKQEFMKKLSAAKDVAFEGTVSAHDVLCHCAVIKIGDKSVTVNDDYAKFMQEYNNAKGLKIGSKVKGVYKTVGGFHYLISIAYAG